MNSRPVLIMINEINMLAYDSISNLKIKLIIIETKTTIEIQVSFKVSAPDADKTSDLTSLPLSFRYFARRNFVVIEAIKTMIVPTE